MRLHVLHRFIRQRGTLMLHRSRVESLERRRLLAANPLDLSFNGDGIATNDLTPTSELFTKVVAAKTTIGSFTAAAGVTGSLSRDLLVAKFKSDGNLDTSFGGS